jgi:endonuclease YncB( thermonuclease family)
VLVYDRTLGVLFIGGANVNLEMVRAGLAEVCRAISAKGFNNDPYDQTEDESRKAVCYSVSKTKVFSVNFRI